jgi:hypothetical protein
VGAAYAFCRAGFLRTIVLPVSPSADCVPRILSQQRGGNPVKSTFLVPAPHGKHFTETEVAHGGDPHRDGGTGAGAPRSQPIRQIRQIKRSPAFGHTLTT